MPVSPSILYVSTSTLFFVAFFSLWYLLFYLLSDYRVAPPELRRPNAASQSRTILILELVSLLRALLAKLHCVRMRETDEIPELKRTRENTVTDRLRRRAREIENEEKEREGRALSEPRKVQRDLQLGTGSRLFRICYVASSSIM